MQDLIKLRATQVVELLKKGEISPLETLDALQERIEQVEPMVNALPTLCFERARSALAVASKSKLNNSILAGLPVAIKDLLDVAGVRSTYGSRVFENHVAQRSDILVENLESNGGIPFAKSNSPEFGAGGNTFNDVFGATCNPYDLSLSAGGSSGGAAAALACGSTWLAHGSDLAGSLRTPASFCGVTSLRPSPGLIACGPNESPFDVYSQEGPMARSVADLALFTDALCGPSMLDGLTRPGANHFFRGVVKRPGKPIRVAYSPDLGIAKTSSVVKAVCEAAVSKLDKEGVAIELTQPDFSRVDEAFDVPRALGYALLLGEDLDKTRHLIKPEVVWNAERGMQIEADEIRRSMVAQGLVFRNAAMFMQDFDLLICPASEIIAFPVQQRYPGYGKGVDYPDYYRWLKIAYAITATTLPVITLPCGKTSDGLPVGIQLVGKPHCEKDLFVYASFIEQLFDFDTGPIEPRQ